MAEPYFLLSLTVPPSLEESILDWLLGQSRCGFSTFPVHGHSSQPQHLTLAEQVSGRKRNVRFEITVQRTEMDTLIEKLQQEFPGTGIHYVVLPVADSGHV